MKRRIFLTTLLLFLFTINFGMTLIAIQTYRDTVASARERSAAEHYFIISGLLKDVTALDSRSVDYSKGMANLAQTYAYLAENQNAGIALYYENALVYSNIHGEAISSYIASPTNGDRQVLLKETKGVFAVFVSGRLPEPYGGYELIYRSEISDTLRDWRNMKNAMFAFGLILSSVLAVCLLLLLNRLFKPLSDISQTSRYIANGDYSTRLAVKGKDELAEVANHFNHMANEVERQMDELITTAENKQLFIDDFAHELKTPLTAIYGYAEYLQKAFIPENERHFALECIMSESKRIQKMAFQMMELANLGNNQIQMENLVVSELFQEVKSILLPKAGEKNIELLFYCELPLLYGNDTLLESLLLNLLENAIKASDAGCTILVKAFYEENAGTITVEDKGKGISHEALYHITQPFYRVEKHRNRRDGGAGLGLSICAQIVQRHNAELSFVSSPGKGTTAKITFTTQ